MFKMNYLKIVTCADPEGGGGGRGVCVCVGGGGGVQTPNFEKSQN